MVQSVSIGTILEENAGRVESNLMTNLHKNSTQTHWVFTGYYFLCDRRAFEQFAHGNLLLDAQAMGKTRIRIALIDQQQYLKTQ